MSAATIRDVAKLANVSIATVSRVINGSARVSENTKEKVLAACAELDFSPHPIAQRLSLGRTQLIAAVLPFLTLPSIVERLRGIQHALSESMYDLVPFSVGSPEQRDAKLTDLSRKSRADGVLIISMPVVDSQAKRFRESGVSIVLIDSSHPELHRVVVDDIKGGQLATQHLLDLGHRKIAFLSDHLENPLHFSSMRERFDGYCQAVKAAGLPLNPQYQCQGDHGREQAQGMAAELLALPEPPTAIFAASDTQAIGVLDAARELGIKVPEELSVIGYDGIRDAEYMNLTTIQQPLYDSGVEGVNLLLDTLEDPLLPPQETFLPLQLIHRGTTAPPQNS
jgi:DNA-binding LacI/PurR family transcriptional regulator